MLSNISRNRILLISIIVVIVNIVGIILFNINCVSCNFEWNPNKSQFGCANGKFIQANAINYYCETGPYCTNSVSSIFCWKCNVVMQYQNMNNISCIISEIGYDQNNLIDKLKTKFPINITKIVYFKDDEISNCSIDNNFPVSISCVIGLILLMFSIIEFIGIIIIVCVMYYKKIKNIKNIKNINNQQTELVDITINLENNNESDKLIEK
jgi:hypothetical protein